MSDFVIPSLFHKGQLLKHLSSDATHEVKEVPSACVVNGERCYQLQQVNLVTNLKAGKQKTIVFYRNQPDVEKHWEPLVTPILPKFKDGEKVHHLKTGRLYTILHGPDKSRLESTNTPAYSYCGSDGIIWHRCQEEMEDGRFKRFSP